MRNGDKPYSCTCIETCSCTIFTWTPAIENLVSLYCGTGTSTSRERESLPYNIIFLAIDEANKIRCSWFGSRLLKEYLLCTGVLRASVELRLFLVMEFFLPYTSYDSTLQVEMYIIHGIIFFNTISIETFCIFLHIVEIQ